MKSKWHNCNGDYTVVQNTMPWITGPMKIHYDLNSLFIKAIGISGYGLANWPTELDSLDSQVRVLVANAMHDSVRRFRVLSQI